MVFPFTRRKSDTNYIPTTDEVKRDVDKERRERSGALGSQFEHLFELMEETITQLNAADDVKLIEHKQETEQK